jgi:transposase
MAKKGRRATSEERLVAIQMHENNFRATRIAEILGVSRASVFEWIAKYREGGLAAMSARMASGRPTALDDSEMIRLYTMINGKDPRAQGFGMALWCRALIRDMIRRAFGRSVSLVTTGRILAKLACRCSGRCTGPGSRIPAGWRSGSAGSTRRSGRGRPRRAQ